MKTASPQITNWDEIRQLPILMNTAQTERLTGRSKKYVCDMCAQGKIKAAKIGGAWFVNRDALLEQLGLAQA